MQLVRAGVRVVAGAAVAPLLSIHVQEMQVYIAVTEPGEPAGLRCLVEWRAGPVLKSYRFGLFQSRRTPNTRCIDHIVP
jgi:hypothetical protein